MQESIEDLNSADETGDGSERRSVSSDPAEWPSETRPSSLELSADIEHALGAVDDRLASVVEGSGPAAAPIKHLVGAGGKRIRPRLCLLIARVLDPDRRKPLPVDLAAAAELIHSASLLHDDVIDEGEKRRGIPTARKVYTNTVSVLSGDHCLASAVELIRGCDTGETLSESLRAVQELVNGEILQLEHRGRLQLDEAVYRRICRLKTASLFIWCTRAAARWSGANDEQLSAVTSFAENVGTAFQIADDLLDLTGDDRFGKRLLDDLRQGRMTLPVIIAARKSDELAGTMQELFERTDDASAEELRAVRIAVLETGAAEEVRQEVNRLTDRALDRLDALPDSAELRSLQDQVRVLQIRAV
ncbi:MAG: polyprenyl synthetase family protein [Myxococcota bacterium]